MERVQKVVFLFSLALDVAISQTAPSTGLYFMVSNTIYLPGSSVNFTAIGTQPTFNNCSNPGDTLVCVTSNVNTQCCRLNDGRTVGNWFMNNTIIEERSCINQTEGAFETYHSNHQVHLSKRNKEPVISGFFKCVVPDEHGTSFSATINIIANIMPTNDVLTIMTQCVRDSTYNDLTSTDVKTMTTNSTDVESTSTLAELESTSTYAESNSIHVETTSNAETMDPYVMNISSNTGIRVGIVVGVLAGSSLVLTSLISVPLVISFMKTKKKRHNQQSHDVSFHEYDYVMKPGQHDKAVKSTSNKSLLDVLNINSGKTSGTLYEIPISESTFSRNPPNILTKKTLAAPYEIPISTVSMSNKNTTFLATPYEVPISSRHKKSPKKSEIRISTNENSTVLSASYEVPLPKQNNRKTSSKLNPSSVLSTSKDQSAASYEAKDFDHNNKDDTIVLPYEIPVSCVKATSHGDKNDAPVLANKISASDEKATAHSYKADGTAIPYEIPVSNVKATAHIGKNDTTVIPHEISGSCNKTI